MTDLPWYVWLPLSVPWAVVMLLLLRRERRVRRPVDAAEQREHDAYMRRWDAARHAECVAALKMIEENHGQTKPA